MKDKIRLDSASWGFAELEKYVVGGWWSGGGGRQILVRSLEPNILMQYYKLPLPLTFPSTPP